MDDPSDKVDRLLLGRALVRLEVVVLVAELREGPLAVLSVVAATLGLRTEQVCREIPPLRTSGAVGGNRLVSRQQRCPRSLKTRSTRQAVGVGNY